MSRIVRQYTNSAPPTGTGNFAVGTTAGDHPGVPVSAGFDLGDPADGLRVVTFIPITGGDDSLGCPYGWQLVVYNPDPVNWHNFTLYVVYEY